MDHKGEIKKLIAHAKKIETINPRLYLVEGDDFLKAGNKKEVIKKLQASK